MRLLMQGLLTSAFLLAGPTARVAQAPQRLTVTLTGEELFSRSVQEGLMLAVPWADLVNQIFPRQSVGVAVEYWRGGGDTIRLTDDAAKRPFDPDRARSLLLRQQLYLEVVCEPQVCHVMNWLMPFLQKAGLAKVWWQERKEPPDSMAKRPAVLWLKVD